MIQNVPWLAAENTSVAASVSCHHMALSSHICFFSITGRGIDLNYYDNEWFALETNRDHFVVFETASKYCISDSFVDHDGYAIYSKRFLPTVVDIMVM